MPRHYELKKLLPVATRLKEMEVELPPEEIRKVCKWLTICTSIRNWSCKDGDIAHNRELTKAELQYVEGYLDALAGMHKGE